MRVAVLGGFAFVLFAIVFFRLWFLQVLTGEDYVSQARENRVRKVRIEAPRGDIVDRNGQTLVKTRVAPGRADRARVAARPRSSRVADAYRAGARRRPSARGSPPRDAARARCERAATPTGASARRKPEKPRAAPAARAASRRRAGAGRRRMPADAAEPATALPRASAA